MINGLNNYFDLLYEKKEKINENDKDYLAISDAISLCKNLYKSMDEELENKKDTRQEIIEQKEKALARARITDDISDWAVYNHFDYLLHEYDTLTELVSERRFLES